MQIVMLMMLVVLGVVVCSSATNTTEHHSVQKRWIPRYPYNACFALACVVAIPLELKGRNVYMSWNFETNFYYPYFDNVQGLVPLPFSTIVEEDTNLGTFVVHAEQNQQRALANRTNDDDASSRALTSKANDDVVEPSTEKSSSRKPRQILDYFMTRRRLYRIIESKLQGLGLNGRQCLLKTICEAAAHPVDTYNGVLGDILHVVFTPSTSKDERLPAAFYEAEQRGHRDACDVYRRPCPRSILDFISVFA